MKLLGLGAALVLALLATACGGGDESAEDEPPTTTAQVASDNAACWKDTATRYKAAADEALPLLRDDAPDLVERYDQLLADVGPTLTEEFKKSFDRLFETLESVADGGNAFNELYQDAESRAKCEAAAAGADGCWQEVARAYEQASERARVAVNGELGRMFDAIRTAIDAAERRDSAAVRRGTRALHAAFDRLMPIAGRYARSQGASERAYEECLAAD
jgi:hypothetical protein